MARRKADERNVRSLFKLAGGRSYAITLPIETLRAWKWDDHHELSLKIDDKRQRIVIEARNPEKK
jgi:hypothetical protein